MKDSDTLIASVDLGTSAVKVCLFDLEGSLVSAGTQEYALESEGRTVQAQENVYREAVRAGFQKALSHTDASRIQALSLTTQGETLTVLDAQGRALRPFIVWLDERATEEAALLSSRIPTQDFYETTGLPQITGALPLCKVLWIKRHERQVWDKTACVVLLEDYFLLRLTGRFVSERSLQTSTGWFSLKTDDCWPQALAAAGLSKACFPPLLESGEVAGPLLPEAAKALGLPAGIPVVAGAMDQTAAALSAGVTKAGVLSETTGTALTLSAWTDRPVFLQDHHVTIYRHVFPGQYLYLPIQNTGGMSLRWLRDTFCQDLKQQAGTLGVSSYEIMDELAGAAPAGSEGLLFLPYLSGSVDPVSCPDARASFLGARLSTGRGDFIRAVLESVGYSIRDFLRLLEKLGVDAGQVVSLGGGASSPLWEQIKADICEVPFVVPTCAEASARGAAILAMWGAGFLPRGQVPQASCKACYRPIPAHAPVYREAYAFWQKAGAALMPLYSKWPEGKNGL